LALWLHAVDTGVVRVVTVDTGVVRVVTVDSDDVIVARIIVRSHQSCLSLQTQRHSLNTSKTPTLSAAVSFVIMSSDA